MGSVSSDTPSLFDESSHSSFDDVYQHVVNTPAEGRPSRKRRLTEPSSDDHPVQVSEGQAELDGERLRLDKLEREEAIETLNWSHHYGRQQKDIFLQTGYAA